MIFGVFMLVIYVFCGSFNWFDLNWVKSVCKNLLIIYIVYINYFWFLKFNFGINKYVLDSNIISININDSC